MEWRGAYRQVPPSFHPHEAGRTSCSAGCVAHGASGGREDVCDMAGSWTPGRTPLCLYDDAPTLFDSQFPADERHFSCLSFLPVWCRILALQDDTTASDWIALGYASKTKIVVKAKGDTGYDGLMEICDENAVLFCLLRLIDGPSLHLSPPPKPMRTRFVNRGPYHSVALALYTQLWYAQGEFLRCLSRHRVKS